MGIVLVLMLQLDIVFLLIHIHLEIDKIILMLWWILIDESLEL